MLDRDETVEGVLGFFKMISCRNRESLFVSSDKRLEFIINSKLKKVILNYGRK